MCDCFKIISQANNLLDVFGVDHSKGVVSLTYDSELATKQNVLEKRVFSYVPFYLWSLERFAKSVSPHLCSHRYSNIVISSFWQLEYKSSYTQMTLETSSLKRYYQKLTTEVSCE